jgi:phage tail-like protein
MPTGTREDPLLGFNFLIEIDGLTQGGFQDVSGLENSTPSVDYREGTDPNHPRKLTGMNTFAPLVLKRGMTTSTELWDWRQTVLDGKADRRNGSVVLLDDTGAEKIRWNFTNAWPSKWTGAALSASSTAVAIESLELTLEECTRV